MARHELKIMPKYFQAVWDDVKRFEIRKNDRDYQVGDILVLKEWDGKAFTGSAIAVVVTYIYDGNIGGLQDNYCILSIKHIGDN